MPKALTNYAKSGPVEGDAADALRIAIAELERAMRQIANDTRAYKRIYDVHAGLSQIALKPGWGPRRTAHAQAARDE